MNFPLEEMTTAHSWTGEISCNWKVFWENFNECLHCPNVHPELSGAVHDWEDRFAQAEFVTKGSNPWTEHFSAVQAEVPDPSDPSTQVNTGFVETLERADVILLAGQALSHCVANTVLDIAANFSDPGFIQKLVLLEDCTSEVPNPPGLTIFSDFTARFMADMQAKGMRVENSKAIFA